MQVVTRIFALCVEFTDAQGFFDTIQSQVNLELIVATCGKLQIKIYLARYPT